MTQEDRKLLLTDLCVRSPYGVICQFIWTYSDETTGGKSVTAKEDDNIRCIDIHTKEIQADYYGEWVDLEHCKPYLRPMLSMTEEEAVEIDSMGFAYWTTMINNDLRSRGPMSLLDAIITHHKMVKLIDWLNAHHFDYRGLIEKGLALEAPEGMYNIKEK